MSLNFWLFIVFFLLSLLFLALCWAVFTLGVWLVRRAMRFVRTEHVGAVVQRAQSQSRAEDEWLCSQLVDSPEAPPWTSMTERPVVIHHNVPTLPYVCIQLASGSHLWCECTAGEYEAWVDGTRLRVDEYSIWGWTIYTTDPRLVA